MQSTLYSEIATGLQTLLFTEEGRSELLTVLQEMRFGETA